MVIHICEVESYLHHQIFKRQSIAHLVTGERVALPSPGPDSGLLTDIVGLSTIQSRQVVVHMHTWHIHMWHIHMHTWHLFGCCFTHFGGSHHNSRLHKTQNLILMLWSMSKHVGGANLTFSSSQVSPFLKYEDWKVQDRTALSSEVHPCLKHPCVAGIPKDITECSPNFTLQPLQLSKSSELIYICKPVPIQISVTIAGIPSPLIKGKSQMWNPKKFVSLQKRTPS